MLILIKQKIKQFTRYIANSHLVDGFPREMNNAFMSKTLKKNSKPPKSLGRNIQKRRKELGYSQEELSYKVGISRAYIGYIEQGRNAPSLNILGKIAKVLKVSTSTLLASFLQK